MFPAGNGFSVPSRRRTRSRMAEQDLLLTLVDAGLMSAMFAVPLIYGGRYAAGHFLLALSAGFATVTWCLRQLFRKTPELRLLPGYLIAVLAVLLVALQLAPLSEELLTAVAPATSKLLPLWFQSGPDAVLEGDWSTVSLAPAETRSGLSTLLAYVLLFFTVTQRVQTRRDLERLLRWIAVATLAMAALGLLQYFFGNGKFFWVLDPPFRKNLWSVTGSFTNRNHFVHFLSLGVGPLLLWLLGRGTEEQSGSRRERRRWRKQRVRQQPSATSQAVQQTYLRAGVVLSLLLITVLLSQSRGGLVAIAIAVLTYFLVGARSAELRGRLALAGAGSVLAVAAFLLFYGDEFLHGRLETLLSGNLQALDPDQSRQQIWGANLRAWKHFPILGTGVGTHREVYPVFLHTIDDGHEFTHAESGYLQIASETGTCGVLLVLAVIGLCVFWTVRSRRQAARAGDSHTPLLVAAVASPLAASCVHSLADFVWYIPGCMATTVVLIAALSRLDQLTRPAAAPAASDAAPGSHSATASGDSASDVKRLPRSVWSLGSLAVTAVVCWIVSVQVLELRAERPWQAYVRDAVYNSGPNRDQLAQQRMHLALLQKAAHADPDDARIQLRLASTCRTLFELEQQETANPLSLMQIRQTAETVDFTSREQLQEWLSRATGEHLTYLFESLAHARRAVELCPLQGQAYVHLAELEFLNQLDRRRRHAYYRQARRVRPADAHVLFAAGKFEWFEGNYSQAVAYWRKAFRYHAGYRELIIRVLAEHVPVEFFLENFRPDIEALSTLQKFYFSVDRLHERRIVLKQQAGIALARARESRGLDAIPNWLLAYEACDALEASQQAEMCLREALKLNPGGFELRERMGRWLFRQKRYEEACEYLNWCSQRHPGDRQLRELAELALKRRVKSASERFAVNPPDRS